LAIPTLSGRRVVYESARPWSSAFAPLKLASCTYCRKAA